MKTKQTFKISEEKQAAANYVITFHNLVINLTDTYAHYENLMLEVDKSSEKEGSKTVTKYDETVGEQIKKAAQTLRYFIIRSYISYSSIMKNISGGKVNNDLEKIYKDIKQQFIVNRELAEKYVILMNSLLLQDIIKHLLRDSKEIIDKIYASQNHASSE